MYYLFYVLFILCIIYFMYYLFYVLFILCFYILLFNKYYFLNISLFLDCSNCSIETCPILSGSYVSGGVSILSI